MGDQKQRNRTGEWPTAAQTAADFPEKPSPSTASRILHANRVANHCPRGGSKPDIDTLGLATIYKIIVAETPVADERVATARLHGLGVLALHVQPGLRADPDEPKTKPRRSDNLDRIGHGADQSKNQKIVFSFTCSF